MFVEQYFEHRTDTERVHLLVIELEHQILPLNERTSNIEHCSTHHYGLEAAAKGSKKE